MLINQNIRIKTISKAPISYRAKDILVGAERYLQTTEELTLIDMVADYYGSYDQSTLNKIKMIWQCQFACWILHNNKSGNRFDDQIILEALQIYHQEAQRFLSSLFHLDHTFWKAFYNLQHEESTKPLCALESLIHVDQSIESVSHQLIRQSVKSILFACIEQSRNDKADHFLHALRMLGDLPLEELKSWIKNKLSTLKTSSRDIWPK